MKYSILKYGSFIRGNSDKYSDKDLLIVTENYDDTKHFEKIYPESEWSISYYTYDKLEYLSRNGYLFIKHLIEEGSIEIDMDNGLKKILDLFEETIDYEKEIKNTKCFFDFLNTIPNNIISLSWLCDNIYVNFRNFLIYNSANNKKYKFSYLELINELMQEKLINETEKNILEELRVLKSCYRSGFSDIKPDLNYLKYLLQIMKKFGINVNINFSDNLEIWKYYNLNFIDKPYKKLRLIELIYHNIGIEDNTMLKYITNPQMYANSKSIEKVIGRLVENIQFKNGKVVLENGFIVNL